MKTFKYAALMCAAMMSGLMFTACSDDENIENNGNGSSESYSGLYTTRPTNGAGFQAFYDDEGMLTGYMDCEGLIWEVVSLQPLKLKSSERYGDGGEENYEVSFNQNKKGLITSGKLVYKAYEDFEEEEAIQTITLNCSYNSANQLSKVTISLVGQEKREGKTETETLEGTANLTYSDGKLIKTTGSYKGKDVGEKYTLKGDATYSYENGVDNKMKQFGYCILNTAVPTFNIEMFAPLFEIGMFGSPSVQLPSNANLSTKESWDDGLSWWAEQEVLDAVYAMDDYEAIRTEKIFSNYREDYDDGESYSYSGSFTYNYTYWFAPAYNQTIKQNVLGKAKRTHGFFKSSRTKRNTL